MEGFTDLMEYLSTGGNRSDPAHAISQAVAPVG